MKYQKEKKKPMKNISISLPLIYLHNIQRLVNLQLVPNRSEAVRTAIHEFLYNEYDNLELMGFFEEGLTDG